MQACPPRHPIPGKGRYPSSYDAQAPETIFHALGLKPGSLFLDAGCGRGAYALEAARLIGPTGTVHAFDITPGCIEDVTRQAAEAGLPQIQAQVADITRPLPLPDASITACLLATVLHMPPVTRAMPSLFAEIHRVMRPEGRLGVIECNQHAFSGPPLPLRLAAKRIIEELERCGFQFVALTDMGYNYLALCQRL